MLNDIPADFNAVFFCPTCGCAYSKEREARKCFEDAEVPIATVGEVVLVQNGYDWFDGDPAWVIERGGYKFHEMTTHAMWFVVSAITTRHEAGIDTLRPFASNRSAHRLAYHLWTKGVLNGDEEGRCGWTHPATHVGFTRANGGRKPSQAVIEQAKTMLGRVTTHLL